MRPSETIVESIADVIFVCDVNGTITLVNEAGLALIGEEHIEERLTLADYFNALQLRFPDGRRVELDEPAVTRALRGEVVRGLEEVGIYPKTNSRLDLLVSAAPLRDQAGLVVGAVEAATDITREKQQAETGQRRAVEVQSVLNNMVDGVFASDTNECITLANEAGLRQLGFASFEEIKGCELARFIDPLRMRHPDGKAFVRHDLPLVRALQGEIITQEQETIHNKQTERDVYLVTSASPIRDEKGKIVGAVEVDRDVTELIKLDQLKDQFIFVAAHKLKTPVAIMKGYAQALLRAKEMITPSIRKMLDSIDRGADRIDRIVRDLLDISRLHVGQLDLVVERIDPPEMVEQVVDRKAASTTKHRLRIVKAEPVVVEGDRVRLEQVLTNLLDNAISYSPKGGDTDVEVALMDHEAVVSVRDYGVGIPRDKQRHIFERFYRAHTRTPYDYGGMGVGLYISREVMRRHGGRMWFESEEDRGSTFYFSIPLREEHAEEHANEHINE